MRDFGLAVLVSIVTTLSLSAQTPTTATETPRPQSARQALIEMFMGNGNDDFAKHLPEEARRTLIHRGESAENSTVLKIAAVGRQMTAQGQHVETFDEGPNILVMAQNDGHEKIEVAVEHDSLLGEDDEIELSIRYYKDGELQSLPVIPRLIFTMKPEKQIWRLTEITVAGHIPLTDPDYLNELRREQDEENENMAQMRMSVLASAETSYAAGHPEVGYSCTISTLFNRNLASQNLANLNPANPDFGNQDLANQDSDNVDPSGAPQPTQGIFDPGQGSDDFSGYHFALSACDGSPASKYRLTATPSDPESAAKTFCVDQSGTVKSTASASASSCFSRGQAVNTVTLPPAVQP